MAGYAKQDRPFANRWRLLGWGGAAWLLATPLIAMRFTSEVVWTPSDFAAAGVMIGGVGLAFEAVVRVSSNPAYRGAAALALLATFATIWTNLAVGMIGDEHNTTNLIFGGVLAIGLAGTIVARLKASATARAMAVTAAAQALTTIVALGAGETLAAAFICAFAIPWLASAWLFRKAGWQGA